MVKAAWLAVALCSAAFGDTVTYNYTGTPFDRCNGSLSGSGNCQPGFSSDYNTASFTFSAPLAANLSAADELSSSSLTAWSISDAKGIAAFSSADVNAASELQQFLLSTDANGAITSWGVQASNLINGVSGNLFFLTNPTVIGGGTGLPLADALVANGGGNGGIGPPGPGVNLGNSIPGHWTETLNGFQGGTAAAPISLLVGSPLAVVNSTIEEGAQDYYSFLWAGGAFSATAAVTNAPDGAAYVFSEGGAGSCTNLADVTLNKDDTFTGTISVPNLAPGQYCIGVDATNSPDPDVALTFNTPVGPVPEPSTLGLLSIGVAIAGMVGRHKRG